MSGTQDDAPQPGSESVIEPREQPQLILDLTRLPALDAALVCDGDDSSRERLVETAIGAGFGQVTQTRRGIEAVEHAAATQPSVAIVDLASTGHLGLRVIGAIRSVAPSCLVVLITPFPDLVEPAVAAGAHAVIEQHDLRPLHALLSDLVDREL